jgi:uroporphyrin-III C-methyltransferase
MNAQNKEGFAFLRGGATNGRGRVSLVGAGPGDPDLLTVRAVRRLVDADVVVYDNLVGDGILELIPAHVERIYVGKETSNHTLPQHEINALLVAQARMGRRVVRLKGGDPFVFGRGGEELQELAQGGVAVEVVPGITAALGAAAGTGIPLTHRDFAQSCVFVTGHLKDGSVDLDWPALARPGQTIVIYMGIAGLEHIASRLVAHGLPSTTPVALVRNASRTDQETVVGRLDDISERAAQCGIRPPALIVIGEVVSLYDPALAESMASFAGRPAPVSLPQAICS